MPLIREDVVRLPREQRLQFVSDLQNVIQNPSAIGPVIFEIPFAGSRYDVMVVWDKWKGIRPDERAEIISEAYSDRTVDVGHAMGVTYDEAMQDHLLPYQIQPCAREGEADPAKLRKAMLDEGAISLGEGKLELRFPTSGMAKAAYDRLTKNIPAGHWALVVDNANALERY